METRVIPKTELRNRIRKELADLGDATLLITERGRPLAVTIGVKRWNDLQQSIEELEDAVAILEQRLSRQSGIPAEDVFAQIEAEQADLSSPARKTG
ncbi:MAG: hypothetical protein ACR2FO_04470 [Actinomycetota bacterium]